MADEAEILVHIAAPSTSTDDALYRAYAQAYLDFEPWARTNLPAPQDPLNAPPSSDEFRSPQLSFSSVWENIRSPTLARVKKTGDDIWHPKATQESSQHEHPSQSSWVPPPSELPDSMPDNDITMEGFNTPTRILNYFLQTAEPFSESFQEIGDGRRATTIYEGDGNFTSFLAQEAPLTAQQSSQGGPLEQDIVLGTPADSSSHSSCSRDAFEETTTMETPATRNCHQRHVFEDTTVVDTPVIRSPLGKRPAPPVRSSGQTQSEVTETSLNSASKNRSFDRVIPSTQLPERADSEPPSSKRRRLNRPGPAFKALTIGRSASDILPRRSQTALTISTHASAQDEVDSTEPPVIDWTPYTHIDSVEPAPSNHKLGPKPPAYLELFVKKLDMKARYKPKFQAREMRAYERGYWLLDLSDGWDHEAKVKTWDFLGNFILRDKCAGWGTRACRDEQWGWIRLYGWEHIAGELYIMLYVASYQRTKYMELTWYDGAGKALIIVGARAEKPTGS